MLSFPPTLYPALAPLPVPFANHLLMKEYKRHPRNFKPTDEELFARVLARIARARYTVHDRLDALVRADRRNSLERGSRRGFPTIDFLLDELAIHVPPHHQPLRYSRQTVELWKNRGLIRRSEGELMDIQCMAALLVARIADPELQRRWLPLSMDAEEACWWCYGKTSPQSPIRALPIDYTWHNPAAVLWTPWRGAAWESDAWQAYGKRYLFRWSGAPSLAALRTWNTDIPERIEALGGDALMRKETVQSVLLEEARSSILALIAPEQQGDAYEHQRIYV